MLSHIHEYIRDRSGVKVGVIVATEYKGMVVTGYSKTNIKEGDTFDADYGIDLALKRAKGLVNTPAVPEADIRQFRGVIMRGFQYFRQASVVSTVGAYLPPDEVLKAQEMYTDTVAAPVEAPVDPIVALQELEMQMFNALPPASKLMFQGFADFILGDVKAELKIRH
jgi:hypothetical protein